MRVIKMNLVPSNQHRKTPLKTPQFSEQSLKQWKNKNGGKYGIKSARKWFRKATGSIVGWVTQGVLKLEKRIQALDE